MGNTGHPRCTPLHRTREAERHVVRIRSLTSHAEPVARHMRIRRIVSCVVSKPQSQPIQRSAVSTHPRNVPAVVSLRPVAVSIHASGGAHSDSQCCPLRFVAVSTQGFGRVHSCPRQAFAGVRSCLRWCPQRLAVGLKSSVVSTQACARAYVRGSIHGFGGVREGLQCCPRTLAVVSPQAFGAVRASL